ncbi:MAG: DUF4131 domain-containing protein [Balneolaceae bacterium]|nr:DUF4131 domain-containing protein [Balneolaceae bacterium]
MSARNTYQFPFASYPAVRIVLLFAAGIICHNYLVVSLMLTGSLIAFLIGLYLFARWRFRKKLDSGFHHASIVVYLLLIFLLGLFWANQHDQSSEPESTRILQAFTWEEIEVWGMVYNIKPTNSGKYQLDIEVDSTALNSSLSWDYNYNMRAVLDPEELALPANAQLGSTIHLSATIYPLDEKRNPHQFNYKGYLASQNISPTLEFRISMPPGILKVFLAGIIGGNRF